MRTETKRVELNREEILKRITEYDIYRFYLSDFKNIGEPFCNTLRGEGTPSMKINYYNNDRLTHHDFGDDRYRGDCISIVQQAFNCDYHTALLRIDKDFNLGIVEKKVENLPKAIKWEQPEKVETVTFPPKFNIIPRAYSQWTAEELAYWSKLGQGIDDLKSEHIFVPKSIFRNGKRVAAVKNLLTYCYFFPNIGKWKIYRPFAPKRNKKTPVERWKWDTNVPFDYCDGIENIQNCEISYLTKSKKDKLVLKKALGTDCVAYTQAEDPAAISCDTINTFKNNSKKNVVVFDSDEKGKKTSYWLTDNHQFVHCNLPEIYTFEGMTDFSDLAYKYGINKVTEHFKSKNLI